MEKLLNDGMTGTLTDGVDGAPHDLTGLRRSLGTVTEILEARAAELDRLPGAGLAAETDALIEIVLAIGRRAADVPACSLPALLDKLAIWEALAEGDEEDEDTTVRNRIVRSAIADLGRIGRPAGAG